MSNLLNIEITCKTDGKKYVLVFKGETVCYLFINTNEIGRDDITSFLNEELRLEEILFSHKAFTTHNASNYENIRCMLFPNHEMIDIMPNIRKALAEQFNLKD